jgi:molybdate transport system ATP-binding protein
MSQIDIDISLVQGDFSLKAALQLPLQGVCALYGPSGAGKTSLLNVLAGLHRPSSGYVKIGAYCYDDTARNLHIPAHKRSIGYVFQDARLFPHLTVAANLRYGLQRRPADRRLSAPHFAEIVDLLGLGALLAAYPYTLSGGEAQRVAIGRALLCAPELLLLDEPLSALDASRRQEVLWYLKNLQKSINVPMVMVTHNFADILELAENLVLIENGRVQGYGPLAVLLSQTHALSQQLEAGTLLTATVSAHDNKTQTSTLHFSDGVLLVPLIAHLPVGATLRLLVYARDIIIGLPDVGMLSVSNQLSAIVEEIVVPAASGATDLPRMRGSVQVRARVGKTSFLAEILAHSAKRLGLCQGMRIVLLIKAVRFDAAHVAAYGASAIRAISSQIASFDD